MRAIPSTIPKPRIPPWFPKNTAALAKMPLLIRIDESGTAQHATHIKPIPIFFDFIIFLLTSEWPGNPNRFEG
jgi:hypothetical protein